jgi:hypothetical protein
MTQFTENVHSMIGIRHPMFAGHQKPATVGRAARGV